ncbi:MAG: hypothetical protein BroJett038_05200 [Chloroflexota bacterium]|nr:MAG: hypothetical protein BroJett038_05200 [Chloroflexota bacterium]
MTDEKRDFSPETEPLDAPDETDDARFAPPDETAAPAESEAETAPAPAEGLDIEAALAAVSTLSDMLAEQEAAEQARIAQAEAEAMAAEERRLRLEHPERFFPVPPPVVLRRGQVASVLPALVLIALGAWLTFAYTTGTPPDGGLVALALGGGLVIILIGRWLSSGRWARGSLFLALALIGVGGALALLAVPGSPGAARGWPLMLIGLGAAFFLAAALAAPPDRRLILPGVLLAVSGLAALVVTFGLLPGSLLDMAAGLWPAAVVALLVVWLLPVIRRG